jgi:nucleoside 2-deoxyribosyltransferase
MKRGYLAISFSDRNKFDAEIDSLKKTLSKKGLELLVFVDNYYFENNQENKMMKTAFQEIDNSDFLIAELTKKSIGVGIEIGYAHSKQKPIFYLRRKDAEYSTTASGCSKYSIEYENTADLEEKIIKALDNEFN